ncbi:MAG: hypothetical protein ACWGHH_06715 [Sulfurovaceae bacterium]
MQRDKVEKLKTKILKTLSNGEIKPNVLHNKVMKSKYSIAQYSAALDGLLEERKIAFNGTFYHLEEVAICK